MDDLILIPNSKRQLQEIVNQISIFLKWYLKLNPTKSA